MDHCGTCNHDNIKENPIAVEPKNKTKFAYPKKDSNGIS